jgi:hypothetical protein
MSELEQLLKAVVDAEKAHNTALLAIPNYPAHPSDAAVNAAWATYDTALDAWYDAEKEKRKYKKDQNNG